jgi:hypothetical protein
MTAASPPYGSLTISVTRITNLAANAVVVGYTAGEINRSQLFLPFRSGLVPMTYDTASKWLPQVASVTAVTAPDGSGSIGEYLVTLIAPPGDTLGVMSVQPLRLDAETMFFTATGQF